MNKERLLNVAKALRESPNPEDFKMSDYASSCNTPACALGHYAYRADLQDAFELRDFAVYEKGVAPCAYAVDYDDLVVCEHFGIDFDGASRLFGSGGCGGAKTAIEAAEYIEHFVATDGEDL